MFGDAEHLSPAIFRGIDGGNRGVDHAGHCSESCGELIAEARDRAGIGIADTRNVDMTFQQMVLTDSQTLVLQADDASHQESCAHEKH